jgi:hypothetical protein
MKAQKGSSGIALLLHNLGSIWGGGQRHAPAALPLVKSPGTHDTGGWVGPGVDLDGREEEQIPYPTECSNPVPSSPQRVAIRTTVVK